MLNFYAFGAVENSSIFGSDIHDKISGILTSAQRDVEIVGPYFSGWPHELQQRIGNITAQTEYIINVPENGIYLAKMYYNEQLSGTDMLTITELDQIDLGKSFVSGAGGTQNRIDYAFYLRHKYKVGQGEKVDDDLWILGPAGTGTDQFPVDVPGAGAARLHMTAAQLQARYNAGSNLERIVGNLTVSEPGTYTAVIERSGLRPTPNNAWRIVQTKEIIFGEYVITEKYQDESGSTLSADTFIELNENANYTKMPPTFPAYTYIGWKLDNSPTLQTAPIALTNVTASHTVIMVYRANNPKVSIVTPKRGKKDQLINVKAGDNTPLFLIAGLICLSLVAIVRAVTQRHKKREAE
jgi:hypothetical protein